MQSQITFLEDVVDTGKTEIRHSFGK